MNVKKCLSITCILALMLTLLTGCMSEIMETKINPDGSGVMTTKVGYTKEFLDELMALGESGENTEVQKPDMSELEEFVYDGVTYYGKTIEIKFNSVDELNKTLNSANEATKVNPEIGANLDQDTLNSIDAQVNAAYEFKRNEDGTFEFKIESKETETPNNEEFQLNETEMQQLKESLVVIFNVEFPGDVTQVSGSTEGVTINKNKLTLDLMKLDNIKTYLFTTKAGATPVTETDTTKVPDVKKEEKATYKSFNDLDDSAWYSKAVDAMLNSKLMHGMGNGKFDPNGTLTYAQFCTILANAMGYETSSDNSYWAYGAIDAAIKRQFIDDLGDINSNTYDKPITREYAIAAMVRVMTDRQIYDMPYTYGSYDIPDYENITEGLRNEIILAYCYGITSGVDNNHTFDPNGVLTRAQISQLFYNVGLAK